MKQDRMKKTAFLAAFFLTISAKAFGIVALDPSNVTASRNLASGRVYITTTSGPPTYDAPTDSYHVPAVIGQEVSVADPARAAQGDATARPAIVGNPVIMTLPGTDLVKLADGTWTNTQPSQTLQDAAAAASSVTAPTYNGLPYQEPATGTPYSNPNTAIHGPDISAGSFVHIYNGSAYTFTRTGTVSTYPDSWTGASGCSAAYPTSIYGPFWSTGYAWQCQGNTFKEVYGVTVTVTPVNPDLIAPGSSDLTSPGLGTALAPSIQDWRTNGLDEDFKQASENGSPTFDGSGPSSEDMQGWIDANGTAIRDAISTGIRDGFSTANTDGTNTGAQQQSSGQLAGIQDKLNGISDTLDDIKDDIEDDGRAYTPESVTNDYTPDPDLDTTSEFTDRFDSFVNTVQTTSLFSLPNQVLFNIPNSSTSIYTVNMGRYGSADIDFSSFGSALMIFRTALLICFGYASIRIAATGK